MQYYRSGIENQVSHIALEKETLSLPNIPNLESGRKFQSSNFDEEYTQQDIPSSTQRYILRWTINNSMIKCSI